MRKLPVTIIKKAEELGYRKFYALLSGGKDSITAAHVFNKIRKIEGVIFIDTSIGLKETKEFVIDVCKKNKWELHIIEPIEKENYNSIVMKYGFPTPSSHRWAFIYLKWKPLYRWLRDRKDQHIAFISGTRKKESSRRFRNAQEITIDKACKRMCFISPLFDWTTSDVWEYLKENKLEVSPAYKAIHISGDCLCGAFAKRGEAELISSFYPEVALRIKGIECKLKATGRSKQCRWGNHSSMEGATKQSKMEDFLCPDCQI